jgi:putative transposase
MDHHLHLVIRSPMNMTMSKFMQSFKRHSATSFLKRVSSRDRQRLQAASQDNRAFWMRSFRGIPIRSERVMWACVRYVHLNPVRAGLCERPEQYFWSSARLYEEYKWTEDDGVLPWMTSSHPP